MSLEALAETLGGDWNKDSVARAETRPDALSASDLPAFARALRTVPQMLLNIENPMVPLRGYVGAAAEVFPFDDADQDELPCPASMDPEKTEAFTIEGDSMRPIEPGSTVFAESVNPADEATFLNRLCVVDVADGRRLIKQVRRGYKDRRYNLLSTNADPIEDQRITAVGVVGDIQPPVIRAQKQMAR